MTSFCDRLWSMCGKHAKELAFKYPLALTLSEWSSLEASVPSGFFFFRDHIVCCVCYLTLKLYPLLEVSFVRQDWSLSYSFSLSNWKKRELSCVNPPFTRPISEDDPHESCPASLVWGNIVLYQDSRTQSASTAIYFLSKCSASALPSFGKSEPAHPQC